ncbi:hypothetical protein GQ53DRAFT_835682 [Thozetella sp. PMI_491]|nr:hypothetical protein GQ53DRAFT_835682 [Thozetella sp. PMI_491]
MRSSLFWVQWAFVARLSSCDFGLASIPQLQDNLFLPNDNELQDQVPANSSITLGLGGVPCANIPGKCCEAGYNCFSIGCCKAGTQPCGTRTCYDPSKASCCSDGSVCPTGYDCVGGGNCCPTGQIPCGTGKCYDPKTQICCTKGTTTWGCSTGKKCCSTGYCQASDEICCDNGACPNTDTCCTYQCCRSIGYCASNGYCSACPAATVTRTTTRKTTEEVTRTTTVTKIEEPPEAPDFTCIPQTATNKNSDTLELGTDCGLSFSAAPSTTLHGERLARAPAPIVTQPGELIRARQYSCTPISTATITSTELSATTTTTTKTVTVFTTPVSFTCLPMAVTNADGDVLALDKECSLEFTPAQPTSSGSSGATRAQTGASSTQTSPNAAPGSAPVTSLSVWGSIIAMLFYL